MKRRPLAAFGLLVTSCEKPARLCAQADRLVPCVPPYQAEPRFDVAARAR